MTTPSFFIHFGGAAGPWDSGERSYSGRAHLRSKFTASLRDAAIFLSLPRIPSRLAGLHPGLFSGRASGTRAFCARQLAQYQEMTGWVGDAKPIGEEGQAEGSLAANVLAGADRARRRQDSELQEGMASRVCAMMLNCARGHNQ
jgi:hypothetical protein